MWQEYFPQGLIAGLDRCTNPLTEPQSRIRFYQGSQDDPTLLDRIAKECAPEGFDIVIDDASHVGTLSRSSFQCLFQHLKQGGIYVVEDWGTGYWKTWPDGTMYHSAKSQRFDTNRSYFFLMLCRLAKRLPGLGKWLQASREIDQNFSSHNFGMVGFVKELVDEVGWQDITHPRLGNNKVPPRASVVREMTIYSGHVFLVKA